MKKLKVDKYGNIEHQKHSPKHKAIKTLKEAPLQKLNRLLKSKPTDLLGK